LKTALRWPGLYAVDGGRIYLHKQAKWFLPIMLAYILVIMGSEIFKNYSLEDISRFYLSLTVTVAVLIVWGWMVSCTLKIYRLSIKLNAHTHSQSDADERNP